MLLNNKTKLMLGLLTIVIVGIAATNAPQDPPKRNLKVLPKNISHDDLEKVMDGFKEALGVRCNFCHAASKTEERKMDFSSDEKPEKAMARKMMRMTARINKKFFDYKPGEKPDALPPISCKTCHNGKPHPGEEKPGGEKH